MKHQIRPPIHSILIHECDSCHKKTEPMDNPYNSAPLGWSTLTQTFGCDDIEGSGWARVLDLCPDCTKRIIESLKLVI